MVVTTRNSRYVVTQLENSNCVQLTSNNPNYLGPFVGHVLQTGPCLTFLITEGEKAGRCIMTSKTVSIDRDATS